MATTTQSKSTRTTTKKPAKAVKTTKKITNQKAVAAPRKTAVKKPLITQTSVSTVKATTRSPLTPLDRIRSLLVSSAMVNLIFAALVIGFVTTTEVAVRLGLQTRDQFASDSTVVLGPASEVLFNLDPKYVLAASLLASSLILILLATKLRSRYEATLANRTSGLRWLAFGISAALLLNFANLIGGIDDLATLKLSAFLIFITTMLSFIAERENIGTARPKWFAYTLSLITGAMAWLPLIGSFIGTSLYGMERFGWHVYAVAGVLLLGFIGFAITQYRQLRVGRAGDYLRAEERYLRIDLFTKFAVVLIVVIALK